MCSPSASETPSSPSEPNAADPPADVLVRLMHTPFAEAPERDRVRAFGVAYQRLTMPDGGVLYVTEHGWPLLDHLTPGRWYNHRVFDRPGQRLAGGTGNVYRVPTAGMTGPPRDLVVKFSRFAQEVPLHVATTFLHAIDESVLDNARFNSPFEEIGLTEALRVRSRQVGRRRILTKRPLGIYCPAMQYPLWQLGRSTGRLAVYEYAHRRNQEIEQRTHRSRHTIELEMDCDYILLFGWVHGRDAEQMFERDLLDIENLKSLTRRVENELFTAGFRVLDHKPKHFILRQRSDGSLLRRDGKLVYALIDFELLQATEEGAAALRWLE